MNLIDLKKIINDECVKNKGLKENEYNLTNIIFDIYQEKKEGACNK